MQALVPTDIDVEDKLLGPFTLKQSIYLLAGAMLIAIVYFSTSSNLIVFFLLAIPIGFLTGAFVFYKFNEQPFEKFLVTLFQYYFSPRKRYWKKEAKAPIMSIQDTEREESPTGLQQEMKKKPINDIDKLAYILDNRGWEGRKK